MTKEWKYFNEIQITRYILAKASTMIILVGTFMIFLELIINNLTMRNIISSVGLLYIVIGLLSLIYLCIISLEFKVEVPDK